MGGGLESRCVGRVYGADGAVRSQGTIQSLYIEEYHFHSLPQIRS